MLINRLTDHVVGEIEMSNAQVRSAQILLNKALPDLRATELTGKDGEQLFPTEVGVIGRKPTRTGSSGET